MLASEDDEEGIPLERLPEPWRSCIVRLQEQADHPAFALFEKIGNGVFEDDSGVRDMPAPWLIYRFRRGDLVAYVWSDSGGWLVRPWAPLDAKAPGAAERVGGLRAALDVLSRPAPRPWWRFWG